MLIFTEQITPRLRYVASFIFGEVLETRYELVDDLRKAGPDTKVPGRSAGKDPVRLINYSGRKIEGSLRVPVSGLLSSTGTPTIDPGLKSRRGFPVLFHNGSPESSQNGHAGMDYDIFSAVFYMVSRYEEYLPFEADRYGRFPAGESLAGRNGFLESPVVDLWIGEFAKKMSETFPVLRWKEPQFRFLPTCDIDLPFAYLHRDPVRTAGAWLKARMRQAEEGSLRREVLRGKAKDPFDTFSEIEAIHALHGIRPAIFFLTARYGKYDKSISPRSRTFRDLVNRAMKYADVGIHPSFRASGNRRELAREIRILSGISGEPVTRSRQHYLKFSLPQSYRAYLDAGIREDYSMGFAQAAGFRAGTSRPFPFYDLHREEETGLRVFPFQVMDRTLKDYMGLDPKRALEKISDIAAAVRSTGGTFSTIWHNDAFSDFGEWIGWKDVYLQMMDALAG
jgi:hypothetical protein